MRVQFLKSHQHGLHAFDFMLGNQTTHFAFKNFFGIKSFPHGNFAFHAGDLFVKGFYGVILSLGRVFKAFLP